MRRSVMRNVVLPMERAHQARIGSDSKEAAALEARFFRVFFPGESPTLAPPLAPHPRLVGMENAERIPPGWQYQEHGRVGSTGLVHLAQATVEGFRKRGVPLLPGNRLQGAADVIRDSHELRIPVTREDPQNAALVADAIRDIWDFYLIARTLPADRDADLNGKLKVMLQGEVSAAKDPSSTPRDLQFEQLVGAVFAMADVRTWPAEPDLRFTALNGEEWGAAVKCVRSGNQLAKRTKEARVQLEKQHLRGVIVVNVDAFLIGIPANGAAAEVGSKFEAGVERLLRLFPELSKQESLLGIIGMGRIVGWDFEGTMPRISHPWMFKASAFVDGGDAGNAADELFQQLQRRSGERMDESLRELAESLGGG